MFTRNEKETWVGPIPIPGDMYRKLKVACVENNVPIRWVVMSLVDWFNQTQNPAVWRVARKFQIDARRKIS